MPKVYGIGAAVVIIGALFKILHWKGADIMLMVGLGTEAVIFFLSAFQPHQSDHDWSLVYPELSEGYDPSTNDNRFRDSKPNGLNWQAGRYVEKCQRNPRSPC